MLRFKDLTEFRAQTSRLWTRSSLIALLSVSVVVLELGHSYQQKVASLAQLDAHLASVARLSRSILLTDMAELSAARDADGNEVDLRLWKARRADVLEQFDLSSISIFRIESNRAYLVDHIEASETSSTVAPERQKTLQTIADRFIDQRLESSSPIEFAQSNNDRISALYVDRRSDPDLVVVIALTGFKVDQVLEPAFEKSSVYALLILISVLLIWILVQRALREAKLRRDPSHQIDEKLTAAFAGMEVVTNAGGWWLELQDLRLRWSTQTYAIHELAADSPITVDRAIRFYAPHEQDRIRQLVEKGIKDGTPWDEEFDLVSAKGRPLRVRATGRAMRGENNEIRYLYGTFQDVTKFARQASDLTKLLQQKNALIQALPSYLIILDRNLQVIEVLNQQLLHRPIDEMMGRTIFELAPPQYLADVQKAVQAAQEGRIGYVHYATANHLGHRHHRAVYHRLNSDQMVVYAEDITTEHQLLMEKDNLLRELAHRVKNNFQLISSLLGISISRAQHPMVIETINEVRGRVHVMGLIHQAMLGVQEFNSIDLQSYLMKIDEYVALQFGFERSRILHIFAIETGHCPPETALYLGMLLNELLTNSAKHAQNRPLTEVIYGVVPIETGSCFFYRDDGGFFDSPTSSGDGHIGTELMGIFCSALGGVPQRSSSRVLKLDQYPGWPKSLVDAGIFRLDFGDNQKA